MCIEFWGGPWDGHVTHPVGEVPYTILVPIFPGVEVGFVPNPSVVHTMYCHYYQLLPAGLDLGILTDEKLRYQYKGVVER